MPCGRSPRCKPSITQAGSKSHTNGIFTICSEVGRAFLSWGSPALIQSIEINSMPMKSQLSRGIKMGKFLLTVCAFGLLLSSSGFAEDQSSEQHQELAKVLERTELQWKQIFAKDGRDYRPPVLVFYRGGTQVSCGREAQSKMGPFYCPVDQKVYLDTSFFDQIATRFSGCVGNKTCQFAQDYVIAHLVGSHVQNLLGILPKAQQAQRAAASKAAANHIQLQVRLQADCLAGIWANRENEMLKSEGKPPFVEPGDAESAVRTVFAISKDLQQLAEQRQRWFNTGFRSGSVASCNTFAATQL